MERKGKSQQIEECSLPVRSLETGLDISVRRTYFNSDRNPNAQGIGKRSRNRLSVSQVRTGDTKVHTQDDLEVSHTAWWGNEGQAAPFSWELFTPLPTAAANKAAVRQTPSSLWYIRAPPSNVTMRRGVQAVLEVSPWAPPPASQCCFKSCFHSPSLQA